MVLQAVKWGLVFCFLMCSGNRTSSVLCKKTKPKNRVASKKHLTVAPVSPSVRDKILSNCLSKKREHRQSWCGVWIPSPQFPYPGCWSYSYCKLHCVANSYIPYPCGFVLCPTQLFIRWKLRSEFRSSARDNADLLTWPSISREEQAWHILGKSKIIFPSALQKLKTSRETEYKSHSLSRGW